MKRSGLFFGMVASAALVVLAAGTVACNGLLGIQSATLGEGSDSGSPGEGGVAVSCASYCQLMTANCNTDNDTEYQNTQSLCLSMCNDMALDQGLPTDTNVNTLGCRVHYAQLAASDPTTNCRFAGPLGGGVCGTKADACNNFCLLDVPYCMQVAAPSYMSMSDCTSSCMVGGSTGDAGTGYVFTTDGGSTGIDLPEGTNTLNCRYYHLENAYPSKARGVVHCPHTMPISAPCQ
jgi:hypothetical protein